jgi:DNA-directed RNA polymerase sigma subunit (sigma70/sigma32)
MRTSRRATKVRKPYPPLLAPDARRARRREIVRMRKAGFTMRDIGWKFDITRQRVWQILKGI